MEIIKISTDWAKAEVFSAKIILGLGLMFFAGAAGFWLLGKTDMAKAFVLPLIVSGVLIVVVSAGLYVTNKPRIAQFETDYRADAIKFVNTEIERTTKSQNDFAMVFKVLPIIVIIAALLIIFINTPLWRAISITTIILMAILMFIDSNTEARNADYHRHLVSTK